jgi:Cu+-exporting ATPase
MKSEDLEKQLERVDIPISGMSCASCAVRIEKGLSTAEGVVQATVNLRRKATVFSIRKPPISQTCGEGEGPGRAKRFFPSGMTCASCEQG